MTTPGRLCCRRPDTTLAGIDCTTLLNAGAAEIPFAVAAKRLFLIATRARTCLSVSVCVCECVFRSVYHPPPTPCGRTRRWDLRLGSRIYIYIITCAINHVQRQHANTVIIYTHPAPRPTGSPAIGPTTSSTVEKVYDVRQRVASPPSSIIHSALSGYTVYSRARSCCDDNIIATNIKRITPPRSTPKKKSTEPFKNYWKNNFDIFLCVYSLISNVFD